jgi:diadenylate cyclase
MQGGETMNPISDFITHFNFSTLSIPSLRITDVVDIAIVACIIYVVIKWIRETRAWALFRGILVILVISLLGYQFHFYTLTWIIEKTLSVGVIALLVIFQPELRRALEQIGQGGFSGLADILRVSDNKVINTHSINEIVSACRIMSQKKQGALIAVERKIKIIPNSESVALDAHISKQLIVNIFFDKSPLHDGGIIIRNNRIAYASSVFNVSDSGIGQELGTRHRAAVGVSEESDAYVIVVSEETGAISLVINGKLYKNIGEKRLKDNLMHLIEEKEDKHPKGIKKLLKSYSPSNDKTKGGKDK